MDDSFLSSSYDSRRSTLSEEDVEDESSLSNSSDGNTSRISTSTDDLSYFTPDQSFDRGQLSDDDSFANEARCYMSGRNIPLQQKRIPSPIVPSNSFSTDDLNVYENDIGQFMTDDSEVFQKQLESSGESKDVELLEKSFIESYSSEDDSLKVTHTDDDDVSSGNDCEIVKTEDKLRVPTEKNYEETEGSDSQNASETSHNEQSDEDDSEPTTNKKKHRKIVTSSEDDSSSEESSSDDSDKENRNKYYVTTKKSVNQKRRSKVPENIDFENITLQEARLFMEYLNEDYPEERPKNVQYFFSKHLFKKRGLELMTICFKVFNKHCFGNLLPDSVKLEWNKHLRKTAGTATHSSKNGVEIVLSDKICDKPYRVRDTLVHEMCHAASFLIDKVFNDRHGPSFKKWASTCGRSFPKMPEITRCHRYVIEAKYHYICEGCQQTVKRHSKSLDTSKKICGRCRGKFVLHVVGKKGTSTAVKKDIPEINVLSELLNKSKI